MDYADTLFDAAHYAAACAAYQKALRYSPKCASAWFQLSGTFFSLGRKQEFVEALVRSFLLDPANKDRFKENCPDLYNDPEFRAIVGLDQDA